MAKVAIDWDRDINPNKKVRDFGEDAYIQIPWIDTYGSYPIVDVVKESIVKIG